MEEFRKSRNSKIPNNKLEIPYDISKLGSKDDPCFGKHYDLNAEECQRCGDIELCAIAIQQNLTIQRTIVEESQPFKDINEKSVNKEEEIKTYIKKLKAADKTKTEIKVKLRKKFDLNKTEITKYL